MKKFSSLVMGLMLVLPIVAGNFTKNDLTGMYDFIGTDTVESVTVDFTTWTTDSLYDEAVGSDYVTGAHTLAFVERGGMGFQKWVIYPNRWFATGVTKNALFNNAKNNAEADSLEQMAIYFPPVKWGVKQISISGRQGGRPLIVIGYNESASAWQKLGTIAIAGDNGINNSTFDVNSSNICRIALYGQKSNTAYTSITNISITPMEEPETPLYELQQDGTYAYVGEPVGEINIDFSSWALTDLPSTLTDDMPLAESHGLGFVKWKMNAYNAGGINQTVLFNNNASDFGGSPTNNNTTNPPTIYMPTTVRGIKFVSVTYVPASSAHWFKPYYKDNTGMHDNVASVSLPTSSEQGLQTAVWTFNSNGPTTMYFRHTGTTWPRIASIVVTLVSETPTDISNTKSSAACVKTIENGQLVIYKNGVRYNVLGSIL